MHQRIVIVGTSGSGKTTLARRIAQQLNHTHIELDAIHWDTNWTPATVPEMRQRLQAQWAASDGRWVIDGNYSRLREQIWERADTVIWLDYPRHTVYWRIVTRTIRRVITRQELWNGNRENFRNSFLSTDSIILWAFKTYQQRKALYTQLFQNPGYRHITFIRHTNPRQTEQWLQAQQPSSTHPH